MAIEIRRAEPRDLDWIIPQLKEFAQFYGTKHSLFGDEEYARKGILRMMAEHVFLVAEKREPPFEAEPVGFAAALLMGHFFNPEVKILSEQFWWVAPAHRNGRAGLMLLNALIARGLRDAQIVSLSVIEGRSPINEDALTKRGFHLHERAYLMEV
jgi:hypothetical protein